MDNTMINVDNVYMRFNLTKDKIYGLKEFIVKSMKRQIFFEEYWALNGVSLTVNKGEVFGLMGLNGAGKSTLLKVISGVFRPTRGSVTVNGTIAPLLELGAGFDAEFTARDNVYMNGAMFGFSPKFMRTIYDEIIDFAELKEFEDVAVKNFSSGMIARLGFAIATCVQPDILIVDEVLGVGDFKFREKCRKRIECMINRGVTVLLVSHDVKQITSMCTCAALLKKGTVACMGTVDEVCAAYGENNT